MEQPDKLRSNQTCMYTSKYTQSVRLMNNLSPVINLLSYTVAQDAAPPPTCSPSLMPRLLHCGSYHEAHTGQRSEPPLAPSSHTRLSGLWSCYCSAYFEFTWPQKGGRQTGAGESGEIGWGAYGASHPLRPGGDLTRYPAISGSPLVVDMLNNRFLNDDESEF